jgi:hypothetical protein
MEFSGRVEIIVELDGQITDEWQAAWRDYDWSGRCGGLSTGAPSQ